MADVVAHADWLRARKALLEKEKAFTRARDELTALRQAMPWETVEKPYRFVGETGECCLADLFGGKSQLIVQHFMFQPDWTAGCKSCSFWADGFNGTLEHLAARDIAFVVVSRAPIQTLLAYRKRMGWRFPWVSSADSDFTYDFEASFTPEQVQAGARMNYGSRPAMAMDLPGVSVFARGEDGAVFHSYSAYARGLDMLNGAYHYIDLTPKGRDDFGTGQSWVRRRDEY